MKNKSNKQLKKRIIPAKQEQIVSAQLQSKGEDNLSSQEPIKGQEIIKRIHVTEKSTNLIAENNQYTFQVFPRATKRMVEEAIKEFYKVEVEEVRIINIPAKKKKIPRIPTRFGWKKGYKKAIVKLKPQHKIEF